MKIFFIIILFVLNVFVIKAGFTQVYDQPAYIDNISNKDKTINLTVCLFPYTIFRNDSESYTGVTFRVVNFSTTPMMWNDYKVYVQLKDGSLFYNYKTKAQSGYYNCNYTIDAKNSHDQFLCFTKKFCGEDISKVYVSFSDNQFYNLIYKEGKK